MRDFRRPSSNQGDRESHRPAPVEAARLARGSRSGDFATVGRPAERHEPRWRDIQWVGFTIGGDSGRTAEPAASPPPVAGTQDTGTMLRHFAQPARDRAHAEIPGLAARFAKLPLPRPAAPPPAAQPPTERRTPIAMVAHPRRPEPRAAPTPIPAALSAPPPAAAAPIKTPAASVRGEPTDSEERFPAAILTPVSTQPEPRTPTPSITARLAARLAPSAAIVRRRGAAIAGAVNAGLTRVRAASLARRSPAEPSPKSPVNPISAAAPAPEPTPRVAGPSRLAAVAGTIEAAALRLTGNGRRRFGVWRTVGGGAIAIAIVAYLIGDMLAGLASTTLEHPSDVASAQPTQSVRAIPMPPPSPQLKPEAQAPQVPVVPPSDPAGRAAFYLARAKAGDPAAQYDVGVLYARGIGLVQDYASAASWFRAAAAQGNIGAQYNLGVLYEGGLGVTASATEAINWYRSAADQNHAGAQYNLALAFAEGRGTEQDLPAAIRWYQRAARQGLVPAMVNLAILYERGRGVDRSLIDAYAWYSAAGERGDAAAKDRAAALFRQFGDQEKARAEGLAATISAAVNGAPSPPA